MALFIDINPNYGKSSLGELVEDVDAINSSIENILGTAKGERFFLPEFGSDLPQLLFEPIDNITASDIRSETIRALEIWEPRIRIITSESFVEALPDRNRYNVQIAYTIVATGAPGTFNKFLLAD